jgi:LytS/YehU family sensor histidine kinase
MFFGSFRLHLMTYLPIIISIQSMILSRDYQQEKLRAAKLEANLAKTQLHVLNAQINPHFLFNTHNAISALIYENPEAADQCLTDLSELLRLSLISGRRQKITVKEEVDFLRKYIQIQKTLLQDRLQVNWEISPETLDAEIPNMILQPLVENSIRHGISPQKNGGQIQIVSKLENGMLNLSVRDNGRGLVSKKDSSGGFGLNNTRARLGLLYGKRHEFKITQPSNGGLLVDLKMPFEMDKAERESKNAYYQS